MQITIKQKSTGRYEELWVDGKMVSNGDISDRIYGFIDCLDYLKIDYTIAYESIPCKFGCD
jgi:hypothetical protein